MSVHRFTIPDTYRKRPTVAGIPEESDEGYEEPFNDELAMVLGLSLEESDPTIANSLVPDIQFSSDARVVGTQHSSISLSSRKPDCVIEDPVNELIVVMEHKLGSEFEDQDYYRDYRENIETQTAYDTKLVLISDSHASVPPKKSDQHVRFQDVYEDLIEANSSCPGLKSYLIEEFDTRNLNGSQILPTQSQLNALEEFHDRIFCETKESIAQKSPFPVSFNLKPNSKTRRETRRLHIAISEGDDTSPPRVNVKPAIPGQDKNSSHRSQGHHFVEVKLRHQKENTGWGEDLNLDEEQWDIDRNSEYISGYQAFELEGRSNTELWESFQASKNEISDAIILLLNCIQQHH